MTNEIKNVPELRFPEFKEEWSKLKLGELAEIVRGSSPRPISDPRWFDINSDIGWLRISDVTEQNGKITKLEQKISKDGQKKTRVLHSKHLLLSIAATVGKPVINYVKTGVHDGFLIFLRPLFDIEFMYQWLDAYRPKWKKYGQPGSQVNLNSELVKSQKIYMPHSVEQKKISDFFSKLDCQIELEEQKLEKLEEQKKGYMQKIFSKELRFKDENGNNYPEWEEKNLKELIDVRDGTHESPKPSKDGYLLVTSKNLKNSKLDLSESYFISKEDYESINQRSKVEIGDILFGMIGTIGNPILLEECDFAIKNVALLKTNDLLEKYYILNFLKSSNISKQFYRMNAGGTQKFIALSTIRDLNIDMPSSEEAIKIGNFFNKVDNLIENQSNKLELLKKRKQGFLQKMFI